MSHLMIDIETMSIESNASIVSIGAVFFDRCGVDYKKTFYEKISLQSCIDLGLKIDANTVLWWFGQSDEARKEFLQNENFHIKTVLENFVNFYDNNKGCNVWGNGSNFDIVIVENALKKCNIKIPWKYYNVRCFRTYKAVNPVVKNIPKDRPAHNALEDAIWQAEYCVELLNKKY